MNQNKKNLTGTSLVGDSVNRERVKDDYYATPKEATESLLHFFDLSDCETFYEPACGEGHISEVLKDYYSNKHIHSSLD